MKHTSKWILSAILGGIFVSLITQDADAARRRLGSGSNSGVQREVPKAPAAATPAAPTAGTVPGANAAKPGTAAPTAGLNPAAAAPKPSFMSRFGGPLAGILAGTALGYMLSQMGLGSGFLGGLLMILLLGVIGFVVWRFIKSRNAGANSTNNMSYAGATPAYGGAVGGSAGSGSSAGTPFPSSAPSSTPAAAFDTGASSSTPAPSGAKNIFGQPLETNGVAPAQFNGAYVEERTQAPKIPADFAVEPFVGEARKQFVRLQAANDSGDVSVLREFMTPSLYGELAPDIIGRNGAAQRVDIMTLNATLIEVADEPSRFIASVRFVGTMKDAAEPIAESFDEIWHIEKLKPNGGWLLAGIQQVS